MSSIALVASYLDPSRKAELAKTLASELGTSLNSLNLLCELLPSLDEPTRNSIYPSVLEFCTTSTDYPSVSKLVVKLPKLKNDLFNRSTESLKEFSYSSKVNFLPFFKASISSTATSDQGSGSQDAENENDNHVDPASSILSTLEFLDYMFMNNNDDRSGEYEMKDLDYNLLLLLGYNDETVTSKVSSIMRWRINEISQYYSTSDFLWDLIFALENSSLKVQRGHAYIFWLRLIQCRDVAEDNSSIVVSDHYWKCIQRGLTSSFHEHRKFCLSILQVSIKSISSNSSSSFANSIMKWDSTQNAKYTKEWSRFVTLFEILAIDTSLHQAEAGTKDIIGLISPQSLIHSSWGFSLLSTGFHASMDSVRKFALSLLYSIPASSLYLIKNGLKHLTDTFLPNAMLASHFNVRKVGCTNQNHCEYAERLHRFIFNIVQSGKENCNDSELRDIVNAILVALITAESFDPARIYVALGLLQGLKDKPVLLFEKDDDSNLLSLFEYSCEGKIFETTFQTICLRLLLEFQIKSNTDVTRFFSALHKFFKFNGGSILKDNVANIKKCLSQNNVTETDLLAVYQNTHTDNKALIIGILSQSSDFKGNLVEKDEKFLIATILDQGIADLVSSGITSNIICLLDETRFDSKGDELKFYETVSSVQQTTWKHAFHEDFDFENHLITTLSRSWTTINEEVQSGDEFTLICVAKKLKLFANLYNEINPKSLSILSISELLKFNDILFVNSKEVAKRSTTFYKVKEEALAQVYRITLHFISDLILTDADVESILDIANCNSSSPELNFALAEVFANLIEKHISSLATITSFVARVFELWSTLNAARLFLNQKDLHCLIIRSMYHAKVLDQSASVGDTLLKFGKEVLENAQGRRCLLPTITKMISDYQISRESVQFSECLWIPEILVRGFATQQLSSNVFRLENIVGKLFDEQVSQSGGKIYSRVYGLEEISARINIMAIFASTNSEQFSKNIINFIFDNEEEFNLLEVTKRTDGFEEWRRIQLMSIVLITSRNLPAEYMLQHFYNIFVGLLETDPSPLARVYVEWMIASYLLESEYQTRETFDYLKKLVEMNGGKPTLLTSYERILCMMITQKQPKVNQESLLKEFLTVIVPAATSNKAITRHFSLSLICTIYPNIVKENLDIGEELFKVVMNMYQTAVQSESFTQHRSGDATIWDIVKDMSLVSISGGVLLRVSDRDIDFITQESYQLYLSEKQKSALLLPIGENFEELWIKERKFQGNKKTLQKRDHEDDDIKVPLQTKSGALNSIVDVDCTETISVTRSDLIVVASLVDKPPNLGGICRLSDVLGAGTLTLHDLNVKNHPQFKTVAVTADRWMPMVEVKPENIIPYFHAKKKEGYTLIGLEQTDKSVELNNELVFPKKSLILLGREKEGIPGELLAELDFCVEIKQVGVIRSMNIQTATAIIAHAYSTQHC